VETQLKMFCDLGIAQRRKSVFTENFFAHQTSVLALDVDTFAQDASRFYRTVGSHLDPQAQHPVYLSTLLWREGVERLRRDLGVGFK
jgi:hypothetical protein